jgi:hypothetical protein
VLLPTCRSFNESSRQHFRGIVGSASSASMGASLDETLPTP